MLTCCSTYYKYLSQLEDDTNMFNFNMHVANDYLSVSSSNVQVFLT